MLTLFLIVIISLMVVRVGTNALVLTGMSQEAAQFQASSAFFGVGFTTAEAEMVMSHSVRRKVVRHLIIAGNIGLTSALTSLIVTFMQEGSGETSRGFHLLVLVLGVTSLALLFNLKWIKKPLDAVMIKQLKSAGVVRAMDYDLLLKVQEGFCVSEVVIHGSHPWCGKKLKQSRPSDNGVVVLNVRHQDGGFTGAPDKDFVLQEGDELMVYGSDASVRNVARVESDESGD